MKSKKLVWFLPIILLVAAVSFWIYQRNKEPNPETALIDFDVSGKTSEEIAVWIYENYNCSGCHGFTDAGAFGLTARGQELAKDFEGCVGMLTSVTESLNIPQSEWTDQHRKVRKNFVTFGCSVCHQLGQNRVGLTKVGAKAASLHMSCPEVANLLRK
ncbi:MAG: hypothetical protein HY645_03155 [Acidobacteria bacterium]|nr:hypothetical protein [Acidobacteriota bacterium]